MFNTSYPYQQQWPSVANYSLNSTLPSSSTVDNIGNVILPPTFVPTRRSPPPSPPWGSTTVQRNMTINVSYKLQPLGILPTNSYFPNGRHVGNVMLCTLTPVIGEQRDLAKYQHLKLHRVKAIRNRKRASTAKSFLFNNLTQRKLKRLQRPILIKAKKQEVYEKWEKRKFRQEFRKRRRIRERIDLDGDTTMFSLPDWLMNTTRATCGSGSESSFKCPVWSCTKKHRRSRRDAYDDPDKYAQLRRRRPSRLSGLSDKSRSPITIRSSPFL